MVKHQAPEGFFGHGLFFSFVGGDGHFDDGVGVGDGAVLGGVAFFDVIDEVHAFGDLAPDGVLAIEPRIVGEHDEELGIGGVGRHGAGHAGNAANVGHGVKLGFEVGLGTTADAIAIGAAGLGHEAFDYAVPEFAVIVPLAGEFLNTGDVVGGLVGEHLDGDAAIFEVEIQCVFKVLRLGLGGLGHEEDSGDYEGFEDVHGMFFC